MNQLESKIETVDPPNPLSILIADDDPDIAMYLKARCQEAGFSVTAVDDALTALCCADMSLPNIVILDIEMPFGNGLAACEMLMTDERFKHIPVIIHSGKDDAATIQRCHVLGAHYVHKSGNSWEHILPILMQTNRQPIHPVAIETRLLSAW